MPNYKSVRDGKITEVPDEIDLGNGEKLTFSQEKTSGTSVGGWYKDKDGVEYMAKFGGDPHAEKMFNDLLGIAVGEEYKAKTTVAYGVLEGRTQPCFLVPRIDGYADIATIPNVASRKNYAEEFHKFYVFQALLSNDDLNEENFGLVNNQSPRMIDFGDMPRFLHPEQIEYSSTPHSLASFIGHQDDSSWRQKGRRRYFGQEDFSVPKPFKLQELKPEDISYGSILLGVEKLIENEEKIIRTIEKSLEEIPEKERESYVTKYRNFAEIIKGRIAWMKLNFGEDLAIIKDLEKREKFLEKTNEIKWRWTPQFIQLMTEEEKVFRKCAQDGLDKNLQNLSDVLLQSLTLNKFPNPPFNREDILALEPDATMKTAIKEAMKDNFILHDAIIAGDYEMAKWLVKNDLVDPNSNRRARNHNYQFFRLTPLHTAIAINNDRLHYGAKLSELKPLQEVIGILKEKFFEKNGKDMPQEKEDLPINLAREALDNFQQKSSITAAVATRIQRNFQERS